MLSGDDTLSFNCWIIEWKFYDFDSNFFEFYSLGPFDSESAVAKNGSVPKRRPTIIWINTLRPRQSGRHFPDDLFKCIFLNENVWISIKNSLKFVPKGPIDNIPALVQIMAWRRLGDKPLSEPMIVRLPTHICVTRPQWVNDFLVHWHIYAPLEIFNTLRPSDSYVRQCTDHHWFR